MCWSGKWEDSKHIHSDAEPISGAGIEKEFDSRWGRLMRHVVWFLSHLSFGIIQTGRSRENAVDTGNGSFSGMGDIHPVSRSEASSGAGYPAFLLRYGIIASYDRARS